MSKPLFQAYYQKEDIDQAWMQPNKDEAEKQFSYRCNWTGETKLPAMVKAANSLQARRTGIAKLRSAG